MSLISDQSSESEEELQYSSILGSFYNNLDDPIYTRDNIVKLLAVSAPNLNSFHLVFSWCKTDGTLGEFPYLHQSISSDSQISFSYTISSESSPAQIIRLTVHFPSSASSNRYQLICLHPPCSSFYWIGKTRRILLPSSSSSSTSIPLHVRFTRPGIFDLSSHLSLVVQVVVDQQQQEQQVQVDKGHCMISSRI
jgi:hypothetical protein